MALRRGRVEIKMSEKIEEKPEWKSNYDWLSRRIDQVERDAQEQCRTHARRIRLLVRLLLDKKIIGEEIAKSIEETLAEKSEDADELIDWFLEESIGVEEAGKLWIAGAIKKKGALRKQLGIKEDEKIPKSILQSIANTEVGKTVQFRGKTIKVTTQLKRRVLLALKLAKMAKRGK